MKLVGFTIRTDPTVPRDEIRLVKVGPWEKALRDSGLIDELTDPNSTTLALCREYDRRGVPPVPPIPGVEAKSRLLRAMHGLPPEKP